MKQVLGTKKIILFLEVLLMCVAPCICKSTIKNTHNYIVQIILFLEDVEIIYSINLHFFKPYIFKIYNGFSFYIYMRWVQVTPCVILKSYTFFKPLDLSRSNGQKKIFH